MKWILFWIKLLTSSIGFMAVETLKLPPIYWNQSNPMFKTSNNDHRIEVNMGDSLEFVCPFTNTSQDVPEFYKIFLVSEQGYNDCFLDDAKHFLTCNKPEKLRSFVVIIEQFQAVPNAPQFQPDTNYYLISTSLGSQNGIDNEQQGACHYHNLKVKVQVCCPTTTNRPTTPTPTMTTRRTSTTSISTSTTPQSTSRRVLSTTPTPQSDTTSISANQPAESSTMPTAGTQIGSSTKPGTDWFLFLVLITVLILRSCTS